MIVSDLINRAFVKRRITASGVTPEAPEVAAALVDYNEMIASLRGHGVGPAVRPMLSSDGYARIGGLHTDATLVTPPSPFDGARFGVTGACTVTAGDDVTIEGGTVTTPTVWFYRGDLAQWIKEAEAVAPDTPQFPTEFHAGLASMLAVRLNDYGAELTQDMVLTAQSAEDRLIARYRPRINPGCDAGVVFMSRRPWGRGFR